MQGPSSAVRKALSWCREKHRFVVFSIRPVARVDFSLRLLVAGLALAVSTKAVETVSVMTWNLENYTVTDRMTDGGYRLAYPKPAHEKQALREVLLSERPDVLAVQEIGGQPFIDELTRDLSKLGLRYPHTALMQAEDRERMTAVLSRLPFQRVYQHRHLDFKYFEGRMRIKRGLLEVVFQTGRDRWSLFVVHLKSRWTEDARDPEAKMRRVREAQAARDYIRQQLPPERAPLYLVAGDLNDHKRSSTVRRFTEVSGTELTRILPATDSRGHLWTYYYRPQDSYDRVDFLLATPAFEERMLIPGSARIIDDPSVLEASDHRPVMAELRIE